jgi:spore germination cell wall hydrolase CwlJ-like protein
VIKTKAYPDTVFNRNDDWVETTDPSSGSVYYYNSKTDETSWDKQKEQQFSSYITKQKKHQPISS